VNSRPYCCWRGNPLCVILIFFPWPTHLTSWNNHLAPCWYRYRFLLRNPTTPLPIIDLSSQFVILVSNTYHRLIKVPQYLIFRQPINPQQTWKIKNAYLNPSVIQFSYTFRKCAHTHTRRDLRDRLGTAGHINRPMCTGTDYISALIIVKAHTSWRILFFQQCRRFSLNYYAVKHSIAVVGGT